MRTLAFPDSIIDDGALAVSEVATNAHLHAGGPGSHGLTPTSELWLWARTLPRPELVVSVFDSARASLPEARADDLMDTRGRGLGIVEAVVSAWGWRWTRSRLAASSIPGKAVWFALPLPSTWPRPRHHVPPMVAAEHLVANLVQRGVPATRHSERTGISVVTTGSLNVWICRAAFSWMCGGGRLHRRPLIDLQETTENVLHMVGERVP